MQSLPVSPAVPGLAVAAENATGAAPVMDEALAGESFGAVLGIQIKAALEAQLADSTELPEAALAVPADAAVPVDAVKPLDLPALLASVAPMVAAQVQGEAAPRGASAHSRQLSDLTAIAPKPGALVAGSEPGDHKSRQAALLDGAHAVRADMLKDRAAEIADDGKTLPVAGFRAPADLPVKDQAGTVNPAHTVVITRPDLPQTAAVQGHNHAMSNLTVEPRVGSAAWDGALGQKVVWLVNQNQQTAEMHLNPPNLGPLEVKLTITNDQASAMFVSPHASVRDAVESALPRLREMLAENGITLGNVNVSAESFAREQAFASQDQAQGSGRESGAGDALDGLATARSGTMHLPMRGLVDTFA